VAISVSEWVWEHSESSHGSRLVLLAIARAIREDRVADGAWPSVAWLAGKTRLKERAVHLAIADLEKLGELRIVRNAGPKGCNLYHIVMVGTPAKFAPLQNLHPAENAGVQKTPPGASPQAEVREGAKNAPPAENAGVQKTPPGGAKNAPNKEVEPENSLSESSTYTDTRHADALFGAPEPQRGKRKATRAPASRIPDGFVVTPEMRDWAREKIPGYDIDAETEVFIDYWRGRGDARALKADWAATWRNWMRDNSKRPGPAVTGSRRAGHAPYRNPSDQSDYDLGFTDGR
jgi:hypothetical protein